MAIINKILVKDVDYDIVGKELTKITYAELKALRDSGKLLEGHFYRITDYSGPIGGAEHSFDIIIQALSSNTLSEDAKAILNDDNDYFNNNNLNAWKLKYCLDVDDKRFDNPYFIFLGIMLDDPEDGELLYFSEISPKHYTPYWEYTTDPSTDESTITLYEEFEGMKVTEDKYFYRGIVTVDGVEYDCWLKWELMNVEEDDSDGFNYSEPFGYDANYVYYLSTRVVFDNKVIFPIAHGIIYYMKDEFNNEAWYDFKNTLFSSKYTFSRLTEDLDIFDYSLSPNCRNNIIHKSTSTPKIILEVFEEYGEAGEMYNNIFLEDCTNIKLRSYNIYSNSFGVKCSDIILQSTASVESNTFGDLCRDIASNADLGYFSDNTFGNNCLDIMMGGNIERNRFGHGCLLINLRNNNENIRFKNYCSGIILQSNCTTLTFEDNVSDLNLPYNYLDNIQFKKGCHDITFSQVTSTEDNPLKNITIGPSIYDEEVHFESGIDAECILTKNSNGETVLFYLADLVQ